MRSTGPSTSVARAAVVLGIALLLATTLASDGPAAPGRAEAPRHGAAEPRWTETAWPFPMDQWGTGRAFRCAAADCGSDIAVYVRPKIGFCNCTTGVADDEEMDRVGDVDLLAPAYGPAESGRPHPVGDMVGWSRAYALGARRDPAGIVLAVAFSAQCNVMVATAVGGDGITPAVRDRVRAFLDAAPTLAWARRLLGS